jgi:hypothetical protein
VDPSLARHELEDHLEEQLQEIAESLIPEEPESEDLKVAKGYHPTFFGGKFPTLGVSVSRTTDMSRYVDQPARPGLLIVEAKIYEPCLPVRGANHAQDDRTGSAKKKTRRIRSLFIEAVYASSLRGYIALVESRGGSIDSAGNAVTDERGQEILWIDTTEIHVSA